MDNYWLRSQTLRVRRRSLLSGSVVAVTGAVALGAVGCGGDDSSSRTPGTAATHGSPGPSTASATASIPKGTLNVAMPPGSLPFFNPLTYTSGGQIIYRDAVGEGLVNTGVKNGALNLYGALAESYEKSPDGLTWTFKMNPKAKFHDGSPVTSADPKFSFELMKSPDVRHARKAEIAAVLDTVETPDQYTAVFKLKQPYPQMDIRSNNWPIISAALYQQHGAAWYEAHPIAAGPFKFVSGEKDDHVNLTAVEGHYRKTPYIKNYNIATVPEEGTRIARLQTGEADIAPITPPSVQQVKAIDGARVVVAKDVVGLWIAFMDQYLGLKTPTADPRVRKAMSIAVNRKAIVDKLLNGQADLGGSFGLPYFKGALDVPADPYDLADAKKRLEAAGYANGFDINLWVTSPVAEYVAVMVADWKSINVNVKVNSMDPGAWVNMVNGHKTPGIYFEATGSDYIDPASYGLFIFSDGTYSYVKDFDKEASTLVNGADDDARFSAWKTIQQKIYDDTLYANLWYSHSLTAVGKNVKSWTPIPNNGYIIRIEYLTLA